MQITDTGAHLITWKYSNKPDRINHAIDLDGDHMLFVVSAGDWGDYEWILAKDGHAIMHSNDAYGSPERALMHGLNKCDQENYL